MKPYYEGWYMKHQQGRQMLAVIPGCAASEAFIQVITPEGSHYIPYPLQSYRHRGIMRVGQSVFSRHGMWLHIDTPALRLHGRLRYGPLTKLPYGIMGPFETLPLETKHTVFSLRHGVRGTLVLNQKPLRFTSGIGYMEGDRGHSFPNGYTWLQCLEPAPGASVMLAIAGVPLGHWGITGCIAVVYLHGRQYRFATYLGVHILENTPTRVVLRQGKMQLAVSLPKPHGHTLQAPVQGAMQRPIQESPAVPAGITFSVNGQVLLQADNCPASFEYVCPHDNT